MVLDLEAIQDASIPLSPRAKEDSIPPPPCWEIVCVGVALLENYEICDLAYVGGDREEGILHGVARLLSENKAEPFPEHTLVTWNGRGFDLPVICARAMRHGLQLPFWSARGWHYRYSEEHHIDLMDFWSAFGGSPRIGLTQAAKLIGLPGKREGEDGKSVASMISEGRIADVQRYCLADVVQTAGVFLRTEFFRGRMTRDKYREAAAKLLAHAAKEADLEWITLQADLKTFLLDSHT